MDEPDWRRELMEPLRDEEEMGDSVDLVWRDLPGFGGFGHTWEQAADNALYWLARYTDRSVTDQGIVEWRYERPAEYAKARTILRSIPDHEIQRVRASHGEA